MMKSEKKHCKTKVKLILLGHRNVSSNLFVGIWKKENQFFLINCIKTTKLKMSEMNAWLPLN